MALELLLGLKAGIGRNFAEAESALNRAKELKVGLNSSLSPQEAIAKIMEQKAEGIYPIYFYQNDLPGLEERDFKKEEVIKELVNEVDEAVEDLRFYEEKFGRDSDEYQRYARKVKRNSYDPSTQALTPFGYQFKLAVERKNPSALPEGMEHFVILIDANDMHYWNDKVGYQGVDKHLYVVGKSLVETARTKEAGLGTEKRRPENQTGIKDLVSKVPKELVIRTNGSNGDEFLVDLYCRKEDVVNIVKRLFDATYKAQTDLYHN